MARVALARAELAMVDAEIASFRHQAELATAATQKGQEAIEAARAQLNEAWKQYGIAQGNLQAAQLSLRSLSQRRQEIDAKAQQQLREISGVTDQPPTPAHHVHLVRIQ
jgi:hypothetical protein